MRYDENNTRALLLELGIGDFNATMIQPYMFMGPAQTDPAMAQVKVITKAIQRKMVAMGATWIKPTGEIDQETAFCLHALVGPHWNQTTWFEIVRALLVAKRNGRKFGRAYGIGHQSVELEHRPMGFLPDLPDVPGGIITYGLVGYFLYRHFTKKGA